MNYIKIALILLVFFIFVIHECEAEKRYKIVVLPFVDYTQMNIGELVPDILRSTLAQTGYLECINREITYRHVTDILLGDILILDGIRRGDGGVWTTEKVDLVARFDTAKVQKIGRNLNADYALKGTISLIGNSIRTDAEIIGVKDRKTLGFVISEGEPEELSSVILKELSDKITDFCRNLNAYDDALGVLGLYNQGRYTFEVAEKKLKEMLSMTHEAIGVRVSLMMLYLSRIRQEPFLEDKVIAEGVMILRHLEQNFDVNFLEVFSTAGLNPFEETARLYSQRGDDDKAIEIYKKAISVYPANSANHYKEMGLLYLKNGFEDKAIHAFENSLDISKGSYEVNFVLAALFEKRNQPERARVHLDECMKYARNVEEFKIAREKINKLNP
ncbi:MAG: hypothetical protein ACUBOA_10640 [Candidatus Loosdrechtia sp.]|uniref:hypothetical protein n=1 Tax=Candidatus Loosdrechtia sp. TaxID=3101272 RepID=UPI003A6DC44E|nr:MAG: hypothetical protein QY305_11765 [Candidatus Jettenia sp. AMX2]